MMKRDSSQVRSSQSGVHPRLEELVRRHLANRWRQPLHAPTEAAFRRLLDLPGFDAEKSLIFDSGCGTGASTLNIAAQSPDAQVVGIDQSLKRLQKTGSSRFPVQRGSVFWIQAELASFWRLAVAEGWTVERHYLMYPNPWPKPGQLQRRWHGHPVFPQLLRLGGMLELRCNWPIYADEFEVALRLARPGASVHRESGGSEAGWDGIETPFGRKYSASGHLLYRLVAGLGD